MRVLLFLSLLVLATRASLTECLLSEGFQDCLETCAGLNGCALASCTQECRGQNCEDACVADGCPPGNQDTECRITCQSAGGSDDEGGEYHLCSNSPLLTATLFTLVFA